MIIDGITLDYDMYWDDEYQWAPIITKADRCIDGSIITQTNVKSAGRLITFSGSQNMGWQKKSTVALLRASHALVNNEFVLTYNSVDYTVRWRSEEEDACQFQVIAVTADPDADFWYYGSIKLITTQ